MKFMNKRYKKSKPFIMGFAAIGALVLQVALAAPPTTIFQWSTVVNNNDCMPIDGYSGCRTFNSYNQPSVNESGLVVMRARSRGGPPLGPATHGIYIRDMSKKNRPVVRILDRNTDVPQPNNQSTTFTETPSFPRIDMGSDTIATRGNHQPVWKEDEEEPSGTTGIYTNPFGPLITGAAKLGNVSEFSFFEVPDEPPGTPFEVFPGAPSVTDGDTIVFKGNYTSGTAKTGIYYRKLKDEPIILSDDSELYPAGGTSTAPVIPIANTDTLIPETGAAFGSTAPPSAAQGKAVFAGFDNEANPTLGGVYLASLEPHPVLNPLVSIGEEVPGENPSEIFTHFGEGVAFDGRFAGFWGAWGGETKTVRLYCPEEGNRDRIAYCNQRLICEEDGRTEIDSNSICDDVTDPKYNPDPESRICYQEKQVPVNQGIFMHDTKRDTTYSVAKTNEGFDDLLYWNYSGKTPCVGSGHSEEGGVDDGEFVRWRSSAFVAVSGRGSSAWTAFKARKGDLNSDNVYTDPIDGIYLDKKPGNSPLITVVDTTLPGTYLDPEAPVLSKISALGIEREGMRGRWLVINASMEEDESMSGEDHGSDHEDGMAGIYMTRTP